MNISVHTTDDHLMRRDLSSYDDSAYPLVAQPDRYGFFGLNQIHDFFIGTVDQYLRSEHANVFELDFSLVKIWDISVVLWLIIALNYYTQKGLRFRLRLPESKPNMPRAEAEAYGKCADFLRRMKLFEGLRNLTSDPSKLLVPEQANYFDLDLNQYYSAVRVSAEEGIMEELISRRLGEIKNLTDMKSLGPKYISGDRIVQCVKDFQSARIGDILDSQCGIPKRKADLFSDHLLTEALVNIKEHPNATIGMMAISILGRSGELILAIADNGDPIPQTIFPTYIDTNVPVQRRAGFPEIFQKEQLTPEQISDMTYFATRPGVSRKMSSAENATIEGLDRRITEIGMGLHYIKEDTVITFSGTLIIVSAGVSLRFRGTTNEYKPLEYQFPWPGNLLRISIPLKK